MTTADGSILGTTRIVDNGPPAQRWDLVILGDGYQTGQIQQYRNDVQQFVNVLLSTPPFDAMRGAINIHRVDVTSTDTGADDPTACGGPGTTARTYFDATFCGDSTNRRLLVVNNATALSVANAQVPQWNAILVMVNSTVYGGAGGQVGTFSRAPGAEEIAIHELGHSAFGLADEYEYFRGCGSGETDRNNHPANEPAEANVTTNTNRATLKWRHLVATTTNIPTTRNANCAVCDPQASPVPAGTVGLFEGAHYFHCGAFRPEFTCRMRALNNPFCAVCRERIQAVLRPFLPAFPDWQLLDNNPATVQIAAAGGNLYQRHNNGFIWRYTGTPLTGWQLLDNNPATVQIAAAGGNLYQRHNNGFIWRYTGTPLTGWQLLDNNPATVQIVASDGNLYQRHNNGFIWRYTGTPLTGWQLLDNNPATVDIAAGGSNLYQIHNNGNIWKYIGPPLTGWRQLDNNPASVAIVAADNSLYQRHRNGFIWRYTGS